jgi:hypothetical protein
MWAGCTKNHFMNETETSLLAGLTVLYINEQIPF